MDCHFVKNEKNNNNKTKIFISNQKINVKNLFINEKKMDRLRECKMVCIY